MERDPGAANLPSQLAVAHQLARAAAANPESTLYAWRDLFARCDLLLGRTRNEE
jgi:hypothetical protein